MKYWLLSLIAVLSIALLSNDSKGRADQGGQAWEYKFIWIQIGQNGDPEEWWEDSTIKLKLPNSKSGMGFFKARELGAQGWELVSVVAFDSYDETRSLNNTFVAYGTRVKSIQYMYKRPK